MSVKVDIKELFAAGAHFGHKTSRWHPNMRPFIHSDRGGMHIIDLAKTVDMVEPALQAVVETAAKGRQVLLVSTKTQAMEPILKVAKETDMSYVTNRWLGGLLTNFKTISKRIKHLKDLEKRMESGELVQRFNKLEVQRFQEEIDVLNDKYGGVKDMNGLPGIVFVVDMVKDNIAVKEAQKLNIPVVAMVDSNGDPSMIDYPIACNDDAIKAIELILSYISGAIAEGKAKKGNAKPATTAKKDTTKTTAAEVVKDESTKPNKPASKKPASTAKATKAKTPKKTQSKETTTAAKASNKDAAQAPTKKAAKKEDK